MPRACARMHVARSPRCMLASLHCARARARARPCVRRISRHWNGGTADLSASRQQRGGQKWESGRSRQSPVAGGWSGWLVDDPGSPTTGNAGINNKRKGQSGISPHAEGEVTHEPIRWHLRRLRKLPHAPSWQCVQARDAPGRHVCMWGGVWCGPSAVVGWACAANCKAKVPLCNRHGVRAYAMQGTLGEPGQGRGKTPRIASSDSHYR